VKSTLAIIMLTLSAIALLVACDAGSGQLGDAIPYEKALPEAGSWSAMTQFGAPPPSLDHAAVWTGDALIVWGGQIGRDEVTDNGAIYNPNANLWTPISLLDAPEARTKAAAYWTGDRLLIWGGISIIEHQGSHFEAPLHTGALYDPISDVWTPMSTAFAPIADANHRHVWTGDELIVCNSAGSARYDPQSNQWTQLSNVQAPSTRKARHAYWTGSRVLVWGGEEQSGDTTFTLNDGALYDPARDEWTPISRGNAPASFDTEVRVLPMGERMLVLPASHPTKGVQVPWLYDSASDTWSAVSPLNAPSTIQTRESYGRGTLCANATWTGARAIFWNDNRIFDPLTNTWTQHVGARNHRMGWQDAGFCWNGERAFLYGGADASGTAQSGGSSMSPFSNLEIRMPQMDQPHQRTAPTLIWTGDALIVWGGFDASYSLREDVKEAGEWLDLFSSGAVYRP